MTRLSEFNRQVAEAEWSILGSEEWVEVTEEGRLDNEYPLWRKTNEFFTVFLSKIDEGWEFALHGKDNHSVIEQLLVATNFDDAASECDRLTREFVAIGNSHLSKDEIRVIQVIESGDSLVGVGVDGKVYQYRGTWTPISMRLGIETE